MPRRGPRRGGPGPPLRRTAARPARDRRSSGSRDGLRPGAAAPPCLPAGRWPAGAGTAPSSPGLPREPGDRLSEQPHTRLAALLRMELETDAPSAGDGGGKALPVRAAGEHEIVGRRPRDVGVDEVEVARETRAVAEEGGPAGGRRDAVPADVRNPRAASKSRYAPREQSEARSVPSLFARFEEELHAQADPEDPRAPARRLPDSLADAGRREAPGSLGERPDSREDDHVGRGDRPGRRGEDHLVAEGLQGAASAPEVGEAEIRHGDSHARVPFVEAISPSPEGAIASRRARAKAFVIASAAWCPLRPASSAACRFRRPRKATDLKNSSTRVNGNSGVTRSISRSNGTSQAKYGRP